MLFTCLNVQNISAQVNVDAISSKDIHKMDDLWNFSIASLSSQIQLLDLQLIIYDDDDEDIQYKATLPEITLYGSQKLQINESYLSKIREEVQLKIYDDIKTNKKEKGEIPNGSYVLCISVYTHDPNIEINRVCNYFTVKPTLADSLLQTKKENLNFSIHSSTEFFSYIDIFPGESPFLQHRNSGIFFNPTVQLFSYPVNASIYYDTDSDFYYQNIPTFQFNFDTHQYQSILEERLKEKLEEKSGIDAAKFQEAVALIEEHENLVNITNNPHFYEEIKLLDSLKVYENYLSDSAAINLISEKIAQFDSFDFEQLLLDSINLDSSQSYLEIQSNKDSLMQMKDSIENKIEEGKELIEKAKSYKNILDKREEVEKKIAEDSTVARVKNYYEQAANFDSDAYANPDAVKEKLQNLDQIKKLESFISGFNALQFGATVPNYSEFSITGVLLNGLNINYGIGAFNFIGAAGRINDNSSFFKIDREQQNFSKLYVTGFEQKVSDKITYGMYLLNSDFVNDDSLSYFNFLERNNAVTGKLQLDILKNKIKAEGELAVSFAQNKDALAFTDATGETSQGSPFWLLQAISQKDNFDNGTFTDKAAKLMLSTDLFKKNTTISATSRYIGSGFYTPGNPFLLNDLFNVELGIDQSLLKRKISVSAHIIKNRDNLEGLKETTTSYYNMKGGLRIMLPKFPTLSVDYLPNVIINNYDQIQVNTLSATSAYSYSIGRIPCNASVSYMRLNTLSVENDSSNYHSRFYNVLNNFNFRKFDIQTGWNFNEAYSMEEEINFQVYSAGTRFTAFKWLGVFANFQLTGNANGVLDPGGQFELSLNAFKSLSFKTALYIYPESSIDYITNIQDISNTSAYISATYNF